MSYLYDLHVHTSESSFCGEVSAENVVKRYKNLGYNGIIITDHFNKYTLNRYNMPDRKSERERWLLGFRTAKKFETEDFRILLGMELRAAENDNDYLVYGFDESFVFDYDINSLVRIEDFIPTARENGLAVFQAHPFRNNMTVVKPGLLDGIEVYNGHMNHDSRNDIAWRWSEKFSLKRISGSDFHGNTKGTPGGVRFNHNPADSADAAKMLLAGEYCLAVYQK
ncbi:MAG: PHP domain-containing protein [Clostridiales bacterium]|nr:PHP domain-containing protein [Clostridiales bacterium]